jgi:endonuclease/exonuclease/phosphatase family metal-dependent hydrolase
MKHSLLLAAGACLLAFPASAQVTRADYDRALGLRDKYQALTVNVPEPATWIEKTNKFHYRRWIKGGNEYMLVDADTKEKRQAFDHVRLAQALTKAVRPKESYEALKLPFNNFRFVDGEKAIEFNVDGTTWRCALADYDLVGLQEVYRFTLNGATGAPPFRDALADLQEALAELGADYYVAAEVHNLNVTIPLLPTANVVQAIDRDVILARGDVVASPVIVPGCRTSQDGCNFNVGASLQSPFGPIAIERGFVLVDAIVDGHSVRFVNTHLEIPELPLVLQAAQATELIGRLAALPNTSASPVILVGDINSAPTDQPTVVGGMTIVPPYVQLTQAGFIDAWPLRLGNPPGLTCCEAENLLNPVSQHHKRVDLIFSSVLPISVSTAVLGADLEDKTPSGLWPSDHAGVFARLRFLR